MARTSYVSRALRYVALALVSCFIVAGGVDAGLRVAKPAVFALPQKLIDAAADPATNVVFLGTSRIDFGLIPAVFDNTISDNGISGIHSYNLGEPDQLTIEETAVAKSFFDLRSSSGVKFVLFEPNVAARLVFSAPNSLRSINFFTLNHIYDGIEMMNRSILPAMGMRATDYVGHIFGASFRHYLNIGLAWAQPDAIPRSSAGSRGFADLDPGENDVLVPNEAFFSAANAIDTQPPTPESISDGQLDTALSLAAFLKSKGAIPVMVRMPQTSNWNFAAAFHAKFNERCAGKGPFYFDFSSPREYPELWDPSHRRDDDHLNVVGATIFSRLIAERVAAAIKDNSISSPLCDN